MKIYFLEEDLQKKKSKTATSPLISNPDVKPHSH
jgi:hypothetical protein